MATQAEAVEWLSEAALDAAVSAADDAEVRATDVLAQRAVALQEAAGRAVLGIGNEATVQEAQEALTAARRDIERVRAAWEFLHERSPGGPSPSR